VRRLLSLLVREPLRELWAPPASRVPALDFLRSLAVLFVILTHLSAAYLQAGGANNLVHALPFVRSGWVGVDLFFVLSGFLIGRQLWREFLRTRTIDLKAFLLRRGLRIWPLYYGFLVFALFVLGRGSFPFGKWWSDAVFVTNYLNQGVVMGSWSLCTEEQFYLLAPLFILAGAWCLRVRSVAGFRKYLVALLVLLPLVRAVRWWTLTGDLFRHDAQQYRVFYQALHYHADALVMGLLLANWDVAGAGKRRPGFWSSGWAPVLGLAVCVALHRIQHEVLNFTGVPLFFCAVVWFLTSARRTWLSFLDSRAFYLLSRLSFGMYLNHCYLHEAVAGLTLRYLPGASACPALHFLASAAVLTVLSALAAAVTFCLIEYPFLKLRGKPTALGKEKAADGGLGDKLRVPARRPPRRAAVAVG
jgi:peptidoglycan/LPS O-acetylase OafA/YrhL